MSNTKLRENIDWQIKHLSLEVCFVTFRDWINSTSVRMMNYRTKTSTNFTTGAPTTGGDFTTGRDSTTEGDHTNGWEATISADHTTTWQSTTAPDPTTLPPSQCIDEGCSSEHDGWGECVDFSKVLKDVDWQRLTTEFDLSAGHVPGKCSNARVGVEDCGCCKCMKARIHHSTTTTTQAPTKPWYHYQNWGRK